MAKSILGNLKIPKKGTTTKHSKRIKNTQKKSMFTTLGKGKRKRNRT